MLVDVACRPIDTKVPAKEREKLEKYYDLKLEENRICNGRDILTILITFDNLGVVCTSFNKLMGNLNITEFSHSSENLFAWKCKNTFTSAGYQKN